MALDIHRIKALCFDVDGTLSDTDDQWVEKIAKVLRPAGMFFPNRDVRPLARWAIMGMESPGNIVYNLLDWLHLDDDIAKIYSYRARKKTVKTSKKFWLVPGIREVLVQLSQSYPMAVVSARDADSTNRFLEQFELTGLFQAVATSQTCEFTKPYPHPILWAAEQMGVEPAECAMIGDTTVDIRAGKQAGAQTIGVLCGFGRERELRRVGADLILSSTPCIQSVFLPE